MTHDNTAENNREHMVAENDTTHTTTVDYRATKKDMVTEFHRVFGHPVGEVTSLSAEVIDNNALYSRLKYIMEEFCELVEAVTGSTAAADSIMSAFETTVTISDDSPRDLVGSVDALCDMMYFMYGMAVMCDIPLDECFARVHESNMSKLFPDGTAHYDPNNGNKVIKGPNFVTPEANIAQEIENYKKSTGQI